MIKELIHQVVSLLVDNPNSVIIEEARDGERHVFGIRVDERDIGKIIGKNGSTIKALRALVSVTKPAEMLVSIDVIK